MRCSESAGGLTDLVAIIAAAIPHSHVLGYRRNMWSRRAVLLAARPLIGVLAVSLTLGAAAPAAAPRDPRPSINPARPFDHATPPATGQSPINDLLSQGAAAMVPIARPRPYTKPDAGCIRPSPGGGCITPRTEWMLGELGRAFGGLPGPIVKSLGCWDLHLWNPSSDHPLGKACDLYVGPTGQFASPQEQELGWLIAWWLRINAQALGVKYVIWQGRIWSQHRDAEGWRAYDGGGIYDVEEAVGGHFDHIHVSMLA
jgi:hypothetical protein